MMRKEDARVLMPRLEVDPQVPYNGGCRYRRKSKGSGWWGWELRETGFLSQGPHRAVPHALWSI